MPRFRITLLNGRWIAIRDIDLRETVTAESLDEMHEKLKGHLGTYPRATVTAFDERARKREYQIERQWVKPTPVEPGRGFYPRPLQK